MTVTKVKVTSTLNFASFDSLISSGN